MMSRANKYTIIGTATIVLMGVLIGIYFLKKDNPITMVERTLKIELPTQAKVENFTYHDEGDSFYVKILIQEQSISDLKDQLRKFFNSKTVSIQDFNKLPNYQDICPWWDLRKESIEVAYNRFASSKKKWFKPSPETREVWAFISKEESEEYYLYVSYY